MIESLTLKNFTVFHDLSVEFSPGINVFIGENSTGKTHLLKAAYGLCSGQQLENIVGAKESQKSKAIEIFLTNRFVRLFLPIDGRLGELCTHDAFESTHIDIKVCGNRGLALDFHTDSDKFSIQYNDGIERYSWKPVFIPAKEVLSFMRGFNSLYEKYEISFDQTYQDICLLLDLPRVRSGAFSERSERAMKEIERICGGRFTFEGGGKVNFKASDTVYSANFMAEGFRKIGMLSRLLETEAIVPGATGTLFWDEPEANLNPKLMENLVQILLEFSRHGQQIILATHDYVLLKWFDLLMDKEKGDPVRFHSLYRDPKDAKVKISSTDDYSEIQPNPIDDAFGDLIDRQIKNDMGGLGK